MPKNTQNIKFIIKLKTIYFSFFIILFSITTNSCIKQPSSPESFSDNNPARTGVFILCEGLWGMNNSRLDRYSFEDASFAQNYFGISNPGFVLGDLADCIVINGDTALISVSTAKVIYSIRVSDGKLLKTLYLEGRRAPRKICRINDSLAFVTDLYSNSVISFNPTTMQYIREFAVGPAPEGIAANGDLLFIANSGYGDYLADKPKAGTISVLDINTGNEIAMLASVPNVVELLINKHRNSLFAVYRNLPSKTNETGGIVEYDLDGLNIKNKWITKSLSLTFSSTGDSLYFINSQGVAFVDLTNNPDSIAQFIVNPNPNDNWYSLAYCQTDNLLWVGNAKNYQVNGQILRFPLNKEKIYIPPFETGVNPNSIVFF